MDTTLINFRNISNIFYLCVPSNCINCIEVFFFIRNYKFYNKEV